MKKNAITTKKLDVWYNGSQALHQIGLQIPAKKITALIGASGSGKSTLLRSFNRILENNPLARIYGKVLINGEDAYSPEMDVTALRRKVGMVFQSPTPFPKSIYDNIAYGLELQGMKSSRTLFDKLAKRSISADALLASANPVDVVVVSSLKEAALWDEVKDRLHQSAYRLSGGQQQRLCIARAIAIRPEILLLDEPCSALDPISTQKIEDLLLKLRKNYTIVIVTHNLAQAKRVSDNVAFMHLGKLIEFGTAKQIFEKPRKKLTAEYVSGHFG
jgi:phosphate transport system ATP-binding protein